MNESHSSDIVVHKLETQVVGDESTYTKEVLRGEIEGLKIEHSIYQGPSEHSISLPPDRTTLFLFLQGNAILHAGSATKTITPESIAIPNNESGPVHLEVGSGSELHFLKFTKIMSPQDIEDRKQFPEENKYDLFFTKFEDCEPYTEKIKSPNTISRTVLPADIVPRVSLGTVEAMGPDKVGAHSHPMLEQLFLGLADNDITVYADNEHTQLRSYALLHVPLGSTHWVTVDDHKKMNYMWMDFFLTREGQEWLKTHKPISSDNID